MVYGEHILKILTTVQPQDAVQPQDFERCWVKFIQRRNESPHTRGRHLLDEILGLQAKQDRIKPTNFVFLNAKLGTFVQLAEGLRRNENRKITSSVTGSVQNRYFTSEIIFSIKSSALLCKSILCQRSPDIKRRQCRQCVQQERSLTAPPAYTRTNIVTQNDGARKLIMTTQNDGNSARACHHVRDIFVCELASISERGTLLFNKHH